MGKWRHTKNGIITGSARSIITSLETFGRWDVSSNLGAVTRTGIIPHKKENKKNTGRVRLLHILLAEKRADWHKKKQEHN